MIASTMRRRTLLGAGIAAAGVLAAGGVYIATRDDNQQRSTRTIRTPATVLTSFGALGRDAYLHHTLGEGMYAPAGLDVTVEPGSATAENLSAMHGEQAQFAAADTMAMIVAQGADPTGVVLLGLVQQLNLAAIMARASVIERPSDLVGATVGLPPGSATENMWTSWLGQVGVDPNLVRVEPVPPPQLVSALVSGQVDAIGQFVVGQPLIAAAVGDDLTVLPYADDLTDALGVGLWCTREFAQEHPDAVRAFRDTTLAGLADALARPDVAGQHLQEHAPEADPEIAAAELTLMRPYVGAEPYGHVDSDRLARSIALMHSTGAIPADTTLSPEDLTMPGITLGVDA